ncbi:putative NADP-dependent L-serine/L-allo-threonine dehydrogenase ydfG [Colletotrichum sublineola]|uniref:Putative NADP-dependent L-serine/L-allo-threonine dehydrogenase ydfG n=1 Tax=Colletotrichum sublineola TaxID=1173701 RepID=A0A066XVS2_COLSU|nr:putative NADP-dependent L-serine/L-allo-threonine dehydrogenase ydfG [Colletotrichum sublineola]
MTWLGRTWLLCSPAARLPPLSRVGGGKRALGLFDSLGSGPRRYSRLAGKTVLITGASSGIGRSTALAFARAEPNDLRLVLISRRRTELEKVTREIQDVAGDGVQINILPLDIGNLDETRRVMDKIPRAFRKVDILINNAGVALGGMATLPTIKESDMLTMFNTNVLGLIALTQTVLPSFLERGRGDVINIGSIAGKDAYEGASVYCATKAAVRALTASMRCELVSTDIRVMEISPGQTRTDIARVRFAGDQQAADQTYEGYTPLEADDVAELILFAATRPPHVVLADSLLLCNTQVSISDSDKP